MTEMKRFYPLLIFVLIIFSTACKEDADKISPPSSSDLSEDPLYRSYNFGGDEKIIDIGILPLLIPQGVIGELFGHDEILLESLSELGYGLRIHPFYKCADANFFFQQGDLDLVVGGGKPAIYAKTNMDMIVASLVKYGFSSIVGKDIMLISDFKDKKIAYPFVSNAYFALLETLHSAGLKEDSLRLIPMTLPEMEEALDEGYIDAFTTCEPDTTKVLNTHEDYIVIHRSLNSCYLYFAESIVRKEPEIARLIIASQIRSMEWLRTSDKNLQSAIRWTEERRIKIGNDGKFIDIKDYMGLIKGDLLDVSAAGALPENDLEENGKLYREFMLLKDLGEIHADTDWGKVKESFDPSFLDEVQGKGDYYQLRTYDYSERP